VVERIQHAWDTGEPWEDTFPLRGADGGYRWFLSRAVAMRNGQGEIVLWCGTNTDITEEREKNDRIHLLMNEVNHRARNMLATIQAIINRTVGSGEPELVDALTRRIRALAANQDLLTEQQWAGASVDAVVRSQVTHVLDTADERFTFEGPEDLMLAPTAAEALGLAIHELATNAAKYGALSSDGGTVSVRWAVRGEAGQRRFEIAWRERGGPRVTAPTRTGFGSVLIRRNPEMAMQARVTLDYAPDGIVWQVTAPESVLFEGGSAPV
jgi:two-component sensor histidine kinase